MLNDVLPLIRVSQPFFQNVIQQAYLTLWGSIRSAHRSKSINQIVQMFERVEPIFGFLDAGYPCDKGLR